MLLAGVALLLVAQCVWSGPLASEDEAHCNISCIRDDDFVRLEQALNCNKANVKNLRSAIFQPNMPIPRCVHQYLIHASMPRTLHMGLCMHMTPLQCSRDACPLS